MQFKVHHFDVLPSTNLLARQYAQEGAPEGTVIWADNQTAGYGRRGRSWASLPGNLMFSLVLLPDKPVTQLPFLAAVVVGEALKQVNPVYKWPNDILINGHKVCGILIETEGPAVILGIGVNLAQAPVVEKPTVALNTILEKPLQPQVFLNQLLNVFEPAYLRWQQEGFSWIRAAWLHQAYALGQPVTFQNADETVQGRFVDIDFEGGIVLELDSSMKKTFYTGQILL